MAIKKVARKASRKAKSVVKSKGRKGKRVSLKSKRRGRKVSRKRTSKKKRVSRKSRVVRKRRRSTKKTSSRKRQARKSRRGRKKKTVEAVVVDQEETASEEPVDSVQEPTTQEIGSVSYEAYRLAATEAGEVAETDSVSGYDLPLHVSAHTVEKSPEEESVPESPAAEAAEPESVPESAEATSGPESDYVVVDKEDAVTYEEDEEEESVAAGEESVAVEEPTMANDNLRDIQKEAEIQHEDSSSLPSFGLKDCPATSEVNTSTSAIPPM